MPERRVTFGGVPFDKKALIFWGAGIVMAFVVLVSCLGGGYDTSSPEGTAKAFAAAAKDADWEAICALFLNEEGTGRLEAGSTAWKDCVAEIQGEPVQAAADWDTDPVMQLTPESAVVEWNSDAFIGVTKVGDDWLVEYYELD